MSKEEYLELIESLAKQVISAAIDENTFEVFADGTKTPLQHQITELAQ